MAQDTDLLQAWWKATPDTHRPARCRDSERGIYAIKPWRAQAKALVERGVTTRDVEDFVLYWMERREGQTLNFGNLANDILAWREKESKKGDRRLTQEEWLAELKASKYAWAIES